MPNDLPGGTADWAIALFAFHREREWDKVLAELNDDMRGRLDVTRLERGSARMAAMFGRLERIGKPFGRILGGEILVDTEECDHLTSHRHLSSLAARRVSH